MTDRSDWLAWRRGGIGASDVAGVLGESPWESPWSIWASKVGLLPDREATDSMRLGTDLEPIIGRWFTDRTGLHVAGEQTWLTHQHWPWMRATVDGFVMESPGDHLDAALGVFEAKYSADAPWESPPRHYVVQVNWQMMTAGTDRAWLACLHMAFGRPSFAVYEIERDDRLCDELRARCNAFWESYVLTGDPPPTDDTAATTDAIRAAYPDAVPGSIVEATAEIEQTVRVLVGLQVQERELAAEIREHKNAIAAALGERETLADADGGVLVTFKTSTAHRLDTDRVKTEHPEIYAACLVESSSRRMLIKTKGTT